MIFTLLIPIFALAAQVPLQSAEAPQPVLTLEQETAVRCGAAFAVVSAEQMRGSAAAGWPALGTRGREYFVRTGARLMDETGATRPVIGALFARSAAELRAGGNLKAKLESLRKPCLLLLDLTIPVP
ncbi:hypothetical protein [Novosphingobium sp.]|uniref:hypothetical protein n=1 Tax=Novosphingobium sp. TaxID=1874826 RepID=UPI0025F2E5E1|nr:hypothetical protein [Novosphingobium sp.]